MIDDFGNAIAAITLTKTMLDKHIIDANKTVIDLFICYDDMMPGESVTYDGECFTHLDLLRIRCYRAKSRGDRRISISGLKKRATVGDEIWIFKRLPDLRYDNRPHFVVVNATSVVGPDADYQQFRNDALNYRNNAIQNGLLDLRGIQV